MEIPSERAVRGQADLSQTLIQNEIDKTATGLKSIHRHAARSATADGVVYLVAAIAIPSLRGSALAKSHRIKIAQRHVADIRIPVQGLRRIQAHRQQPRLPVR